MGPDLEVRGRSEIVLEASGNKENSDVMKEPEDKRMSCVSNYEDNTFEMEALMDVHTEGPERSGDVEVNDLEHTNMGDIGLVGAESQDATENSSSFGYSVSGVESGTTMTDAEAESEFHGDVSPALPFDDYNEIFRMRKKRLTSHWRTYIRPLMWRCKWVELQIKKFQSQRIKYDREISEYSQRKKLETENGILEGVGAKSLPFTGQSHRKKVMKRKKRKRVEDAVDISSYMSHHNLFSYYENKRSVADTALMDDIGSNRANCTEKINYTNEIEVNDELLSLESGDGDYSVEKVFWKIGIVQSQVGKMKTRLHKIMSENAVKFSTDSLSLLASGNALTSSTRNPASPHNDGDRMPIESSCIATQLIPDYNLGDLVMPESATSSHEEVIHVPDIIESTDQPQVEGSSKNIGKGILIYNRRVKEEPRNLKEVKSMEKPQAPKEEQDCFFPPLHVLEPDRVTGDQPTPKIRSISKLTATKNKRKRGRRKAGSGKWSRRSSG